MRCPICNAKMREDGCCPYCKISGEQVIFASNKKAKKYMRTGKKNEVYYSSTKPIDVTFLDMIMLTIFTGIFGGHDFYVGKVFKGLFHLIPILLAILTVGLSEININIFKDGGILQLTYELIIAVVGLSIIFWIADIFAVALKYYKYPVVLESIDTIEKRKMKI